METFVIFTVVFTFACLILGGFAYAVLAVGTVLSLLAYPLIIVGVILAAGALLILPVLLFAIFDPTDPLAWVLVGIFVITIVQIIIHTETVQKLFRKLRDN